MIDNKVAFGVLAGIAGVLIAVLLFSNQAVSDDILIISGGGNSSDSTVCTNVGTGAKVYKDGNCNFKTLVGSSDISITNTSNTVVIDYNGTSGNGMVLLVDSILNSSGTVNIVTGTATSITCANTGINACAELANTNSALIGKKVNALSMFLLKGASPVGMNTVCIMNSTAHCIYNFGTIDSATITVSATEYLFYNTTHTHTIALGDYIGIRTNIQTGANVILVRGVTSASNYDGSNSLCAQFTSGAWATGVNCDLGTTAQAFILSAVNSFSFPSYDNYMISLQTSNTGASTLTFMLNGDTNAVYSTRYSLNGASDGTSTNQRACQPTFTTGINTLDNYMLTMYIGDNDSSIRRGAMGETAHGFDSSLATAPSRSEFVCKFNNQVNPITSLQISATGLPPFGTNIVNTGSPQYNGHIEIWGYN